MVTVVCVRIGKAYSLDYVEKLRNMVSRHLTIPYEFACITDDPTPVDGVRIIHLHDQGYRRKWWHKVHMFDSDIPLAGRLLYFDLDVVIVGNIDHLTQSEDDEFYGIRDFNRCLRANFHYLNSSAMAWTHGKESDIWQRFIADPAQAQRLQGDQDWIWQQARNKIKFWPDQWIQSYKWEVRNRSELTVTPGKGRHFKTVNHEIVAPNECSVLVFHGDPKPQDIQDRIVTENWR